MQGGTTFQQLANEYGVSVGTIDNILKKNIDFQEKVGAAQKEVEQTMLQYISAQAGKVQGIVSSLLGTFTDEEIHRMHPRDRAGLIKILLEQFTPKEDTGAQDTSVQVNIRLSDTSIPSSSGESIEGEETPT